MPTLERDLRTLTLDAAGQMALDEAVLKASPPKSTILRFFRWQGNAVTFGYSQQYWVAEASARQAGLWPCPVVRRATGGGVVHHDGDLTFSLVFPWDRLCAPTAIYKNIHRGVHAGLKAAGAAAALWSPPERRKTMVIQPECFAAPEPIDIVDEAGTKVLGGALRKRGARGLYQGSMRPSCWGLSRGKLEEAVRKGLLGEFPDLTEKLDKAWIAESAVNRQKYETDEWNKRR